MVQIDERTKEELAQAANNCLIRLSEDGIMTIMIDTKRTVGPSASGKTTIIGSTGVGEKMNLNGKQATIGVNVYTK